MTPLMIVSAVPLYNIYSVIILTFCANNQDHSDKSATIKRAFKNILTNPIILGIAAGVPFSLLNIELPTSGIKNSDKCCPDSHADGTACCRCRF